MDYYTHFPGALASDLKWRLKRLSYSLYFSGESRDDRDEMGRGGGGFEALPGSHFDLSYLKLSQEG